MIFLDIKKKINKQLYNQKIKKKYSRELFFHYVKYIINYFKQNIVNH